MKHPRGLSLGVGLSLLVCAACERPLVGADSRHPLRSPTNSTATAGGSQATTDAADAEGLTPQTAKPTATKVELPAGITPGELTRVPVPTYRPALVVHGRADTRRAMLYLHGVCGDPNKIVSWGRAASQWVTTIALLGDRPCEEGHRYRWSQDIELIDILAQRALKSVQQQRGGQLDVEQVVVFGYSQGSTRAEKLVELFPERYPWAILGGMPRAPDPVALKPAHGVVVLGGELEPVSHMRSGSEALEAAGIRQQFLLFPKAGHGQFGPRAERVMLQTLGFLLGAESD